MSVVEDLENGTLTREGSEALRVVHPRMYAELKTRVDEGVANTKERIPRDKLVQLSVLFDEPYHFNRLLLPRSGEGRIELPAWADSDPREAPFQVPVAHFGLDWIPAGYPEQRQSARLRPVAEATVSEQTSRWEFWLPTADDVPDVARSQVGEPESEPWTVSYVPLAAVVVLVIIAMALVRRRKRRN